LVELSEKLRLTVVIVTHDIDEALAVANRILVLPAAGEKLRIFDTSDEIALSTIKQEIIASLVAYEI
jgi:ABC-type proline/glycine betaine transport system ATPase subunit